MLFDLNTGNQSISVIIPVLNEKENLQELYKKLNSTISIYNNSEIIFIDDGSTDNTFEILRGLHEIDKSIKIIRFRRNFGQTAALAAGFEYARGDIIITMGAGDIWKYGEKFVELLKEEKH